MAAPKKLKVGIAGLGFMGVTHYNAYQRIPGVTVAALADEDPVRRSGDWTKVGGNFGGNAGKVDLSGVKTFETYAEMVKDDDLDLIDICLPTPFHKNAVLTALAAGRHVVSEKPITLTVKDADEMLAAAKKAKRHFFVAQVLRYFPEYRFLKEAHETGKYGKLVAAHFRRIIAKPAWSANSWYSDPKKTGGATLDLHIHDADFIIHLLGKPKSVISSGVPAGKGAFDYLVNQYDFGKTGPTVSSEGGWIATAALPFEQSFEVYFEKGTVLYNSSHGPLQVALPDGKKVEPKLAKEDGFLAELKAVTTPLRAGTKPTELLASSARNSLALCLAEQESAKSGKVVKIR
jgi:predicted dehydrogenase